MRIILILVYTVILLSCAAQSSKVKLSKASDKQELMRSERGIVLTAADIDEVLLAIPDDVKRSIFVNGDKFFDFSVTQYTSKQLVDYAVRNKLDEELKLKAMFTDYRRRILSRAAVQHYIDSQDLPDFTDLAFERYLVTKNKFIVPEKRNLQHILVKVGKGSHDDSEGQLIAENILDKLKAGENFEMLAEQMSDDSSGALGGDLGWVTMGKTVKPFEQAAFQLKKKNQLSELVKTKFGYHIIKLLEIKPAEQLTFDTVKSKIVNDLKLEHEKELQSEFLLSYDLQENTKVDKKALSELYIKLKNKYKH